LRARRRGLALLLVLSLASCASPMWPTSAPPRETPAHRGLSRSAAQRAFNALLGSAASSAVSTFVTLAGLALGDAAHGDAVKAVWGTGVMLTLSSVIAACGFIPKLRAH
jgi:hypothetical protein